MFSALTTFNVSGGSPRMRPLNPYTASGRLRKQPADTFFASRGPGPLTGVLTVLPYSK